MLPDRVKAFWIAAAAVSSVGPRSSGPPDSARGATNWVVSYRLESSCWGRVNWNVEPRPCLLSTATLPP